MSLRAQLSRHHRIITALRGKYKTFEALQEYLDAASETDDVDYKLSKRTFFREKNDILELYNVDIQFDSYRKAYTINEDYRNDDYNNKTALIDAFDTYHTVSIGQHMAQNFEVESRRAIGMEHIFQIMSALKKKYVLVFEYTKYSNTPEDEQVPSVRRVAPYGLKEFEKRWYLIGMDVTSEKIRIWGLDRMKNISVDKVGYIKSKDFDLKKMFANNFGITIDDTKVTELIQLKMSRLTSKYFESKPLHTSQIIDTIDDQYVMLSLKVKVNLDLEMELKKHGATIEIMLPTSLRLKMKAEYETLLSLYKD